MDFVAGQVALIRREARWGSSRSPFRGKFLRKDLRAREVFQGARASAPCPPVVQDLRAVARP